VCYIVDIEEVETEDVEDEIVEQRDSSESESVKTEESVRSQDDVDEDTEEVPAQRSATRVGTGLRVKLSIKPFSGVRKGMRERKSTVIKLISRIFRLF